jgi:hypothetical protein
MGLAGSLLAGLVLLALGGSCRAAVVSVSTSNGFMDALFIAAAPRTAGQEAIDTVIQVQADTALTRASTAVYQIPVVMSANQTVTVRGVERGTRMCLVPPPLRAAPTRRAALRRLALLHRQRHACQLGPWRCPCTAAVSRHWIPHHQQAEHLWCVSELRITRLTSSVLPCAPSPMLLTVCTTS